ncbi:MAG: hypothetical protein ACI9C1_003960 [Candidatus Aldehydirespiratoraceae bacterium]|jgi:hypothetical protein
MSLSAAIGANCSVAVSPGRALDRLPARISRPSNSTPAMRCWRGENQSCMTQRVIGWVLKRRRVKFSRFPPVR